MMKCHVSFEDFESMLLQNLLKKTLFDGQMVENDDKNDDHEHEMSSEVVNHFSNHEHNYDQFLENFSVGIGNSHL